MQKQTRTLCFDRDLALEAYRLAGIVQPFPNHFHDFYVLGYLVSGQRALSCKGQESTLRPGDMILFNPGDNHACAQCGSAPLHYLGFNIPKDVMQKWAQEITGSAALPCFAPTVVRDEEAARCFVPLHRAVMADSREFEKEELMLFLLSLLLQKYSAPFVEPPVDGRAEVERACRLMEQHFAEPLSLSALCGCAGLSKSALLRAFTRHKGMTPYRYLQTVRIGQAKKLLEQGTPAMEAALRTGFYDQSHFTKFFMQFIGLSPRAYRDIFENKNLER